MITIKLNVCGNEEVLGVEGVNYQDAVDAACVGKEDYLAVVVNSDFKYWHDGEGYGHRFVAMEIVGWGTVKRLQQANEAVAYLAGMYRDFPSSEQIHDAFEAKINLREALELAVEVAEKAVER